MVSKLYKIYRNKTGPVLRRLKVQIGRRRYAVGQALPGGDAYICSIDYENQTFQIKYFGGKVMSYQGVSV